MFRGDKIPTVIIILCFIFGAWPIGVILAILKSINSDYEKERKNVSERIERVSGQTGANDEDGETAESGGKSGDGEPIDVSELFRGEGTRKTNYKTPDNTSDGQNGTTYHYSYVKNKNGRANGAPPPFTGERRTNSQPPFTGERRTDSQPPFTGERRANGVPPFAGTRPFAGGWQGHSFRRSAGTVVLTIFMIISIFFAVVFFINAIDSVAALGFGAAFRDVISAMTASSVAALAYLFRSFSKSRDYRVLTYISMLRGERFYSIAELAKIADVSTPRVIKDLTFMQSKGILPDEAVIDRGLGYIILYKNARAEAEAAAGVKKASETPPEPKTAEQVAEEMSEHEKILHRIRELNDDIDDENVSRKIDEIEALTRKIFALVEEKPEMESQLGPFLSYYLPTTLKLLNSYAYFEEQGVRGENISAGMKNIEDTLDMLIDGYKTQLDKLFESDALDVSTDINVLEQMMKADGFTRNSDFKGSEKSEKRESTDIGSEPGFGDSGTAAATAPAAENEQKQEKKE